MQDTRRREVFRKLRKQYKVSQRQVSIDLNISENHMRNIEAGRGNPDAKLLLKYRNTLILHLKSCFLIY